MRIGRIKLLHKEFDLCEEAYVFPTRAAVASGLRFYIYRRNAHADIECPVEKGEHTVVHTVTLPKEIPKGRVTVSVLHSAMRLTGSYHV